MREMTAPSIADERIVSSCANRRSLTTEARTNTETVTTRRNICAANTSAGVAGVR